ncbi:MAG: alpha-galactosidase, partial [Acidobacteriaceae bacterium]|nr:alpha-galactosidase [Acidobacteriaceae bacterium]
MKRLRKAFIGSAFAASVLAAAVLASDAAAQAGPIAETPPMGWNSWDSYGLTVTQDEFEANASYIAQHLRRYGWEYAVVDE